MGTVDSLEAQVATRAIGQGDELVSVVAELNACRLSVKPGQSPGFSAVQSDACQPGDRHRRLLRHRCSRTARQRGVGSHPTAVSGPAPLLFGLVTEARLANGFAAVALGHGQAGRSDYIAEIRAELEREMGESTASYCVI